jgi:hypothetical protein
MCASGIVYFFKKKNSVKELQDSQLFPKEMALQLHEYVLLLKKLHNPPRWHG